MNNVLDREDAVLAEFSSMTLLSLMGDAGG